MKRTIQCPKCEVKLAVFDIGKPINQKCPKCGNAFVVESVDKKVEEKTRGPADAPKAEPTPGVTTAAATAEPDSPASAIKQKAKTGTLPEAPTTSPAQSAAPAVSAPTSGDAKKDASPASAAQASGEEKKETEPKEIRVKKPEESPAAQSKPRSPAKPAAAVPESPEPLPGGHASPFSIIAVALLILVIVMQVMAKMQSAKQYKKIIEHLQYIETKLGK